MELVPHRAAPTRASSEPPPTRRRLEAAARARAAPADCDRSRSGPTRSRAGTGSASARSCGAARGAEWRRALRPLPGLDSAHMAQRAGARLPADAGRRVAARAGAAAGRRHGTSTIATAGARAKAGDSARPAIAARSRSTRRQGDGPGRRTPSQLGWRASGRAERGGAWRDARSSTLAVRDGDASRQWRRGASAAGAPVVHDAGFTEVAPGQPNGRRSCRPLS